MRKAHWVLISVSVLLVIILYFLFDTVPPEQAELEKSRAFQADVGMLEAIVDSSNRALTPSEAVNFRMLQNVVKSGAGDSTEISAYKQLSSLWFKRGDYLVAGYYAEKVAERLNTEASWGIAGSTYAYALTSSEGRSGRKDLALARAEQCFENAISINPDNIDHRINLAICYAEYPPADNPMKGIQSLLALNSEYPENTSVLYHLARFGLQTGQYDKAASRLERALELSPGEKRLHCLLAEVYTLSGNADGASVHAAICDED